MMRRPMRTASTPRSGCHDARRRARRRSRERLAQVRHLRSGFPCSSHHFTVDEQCVGGAIYLSVLHVDPEAGHQSLEILTSLRFFIRWQIDSAESERAAAFEKNGLAVSGAGSTDHRCGGWGGGEKRCNEDKSNQSVHVVCSWCVGNEGTGRGTAGLRVGTQTLPRVPPLCENRP